MSQRDKRRRRDRLEREARARGKPAREPPEPAAVATAPPEKPTVDRGPNWPNVEAQWKPGQSGNPDGYSRGRRFTQGVLDLITERRADRAISTVFLKQLLDGDRHFFKMLFDRAEGPVNYRDPAAMIVVEPTDTTIDPAVAERLLAAALPETTPLLEDDVT